jgi:hypothetical protein
MASSVQVGQVRKGDRVWQWWGNWAGKTYLPLGSRSRLFMDGEVVGGGTRGWVGGRGRERQLSLSVLSIRMNSCAASLVS